MNRIIDYQNLAKEIQLWITNYANKNNLKTLVVCVSGGIDSAVVSTLCAETGLPTIIVGMPINSNSKNTELSEKQIEFLSTKYKDNILGYNIDLSKTFEEFKSHSAFKNEFNSELGFANTKSRFRMITLYQIAASKNGLVVGTGNKVEDFGVGFYTKYGDGGVDISPIADCLKSQVWEMGKELKILEDIINAAPTDGLWADGRTDERQLGMSYDDLEKAMLNSKDKNYEKYLKIRKRNLHKMNLIPICKFENNE